MVCLFLMLMVVTITCAYGIPALPPLPIKDGCNQVESELTMVRLAGEAVILDFPIFMSVVKKRKIVPPAAKYQISKTNQTDGIVFHHEGRVQQHDEQLWFLPAQASDSGNYTCTYRNDSYCVTGNITLLVYESTSVDMTQLSHPLDAMMGEELKVFCPSLSRFNYTYTQIDWYKDSSPTALQPGREGNRGSLIIPAVRRPHAGLYTCKLTVLINNQQYKVSRVFKLQVTGPEYEITPSNPVPEVSTTSDPGLLSTKAYRTINSLTAQPPVIISPVTGTVLEVSPGSGLDLFCQVQTECQMADSTLVTWLVNGQSVELSYLERRALQGEKRVTRVSKGCQVELKLIISVITEEEEKTEMKCVAQNAGGRSEVVAQIQLEDSPFTWLIVAVVAVFFFLTVVSVFIYVLFKPKRKKNMDYFLARQNSTFSV
ncbi:interleukin-1 receptor type 2 [Melanotaenia boesemani]|uniref:interleukin-1 receptor type 2 n=1 Tax=Melanotaenia boesemani TaxID=1250792 RepID=UPI001C03CC8B|nr:interleukin-1 receptor type 2 [Melanotaenia boesemani]